MIAKFMRALEGKDEIGYPRNREDACTSSAKIDQISAAAHCSA
jgi:hypothetical protein